MERLALHYDPSPMEESMRRPAARLATSTSVRHAGYPFAREAWFCGEPSGISGELTPLVLNFPDRSTLSALAGSYLVSVFHRGSETQCIVAHFALLVL